MKKLSLIVFFILASINLATADVNIGVLAKRGAKKAILKWGEMGKYLSSKVGQKVNIIPLKFVDIEKAVTSKKIDFLLANSAFFVEMEKKYGLYPVATLINSRKGKALKTFGGVIIAKKGSAIKSLGDLKGKKFMIVKKSSFGGAHMAWREMLDAGVNPETDTAAFLEGKKHDNVVLAVKNGAVDAGTVRTDTLERMEDEGKIKMDDFQIVNPKNDDFPFVRSTILYPEWPMAALPSVDKAVVKKIKSALISLNKDSSAAKAAKIIGWTAPLDYGPVRECLKKIRYGAFK